MKRNSLENLIRPGAGSIIIALMVGIAAWILGYTFFPVNDWDAGKIALFARWLNSFIPAHSAFSHILGLIFTLFIGFFLVEFNERFSFIRRRSVLPLFIFVLLMACNVNAHEFSFGQLSCIFMLAALWQLFSIYQERNPVKQSFNIGFFLSIGSFFAIAMSFFLPVFWLGMARMNSFSLRGFLASIMGFVSPLAIFFGIVYLQSDTAYYISAFVEQLQKEVNLFGHGLFFLVFLGSIAFCSLVAIVNMLNNAFSDRIKVSRILGFLASCFIFSMLIMLFFFDENVSVFSIVAIFSSFLLSHYFSLRESLFTQILFWLLVAVSVVVFFYSMFYSYVGKFF
ncbi:MAG: DUF6427 family protein [Prevotellaceae bacterium]|jgi:hypothetical protein|nr:DUF6427 family protein [Prevotellaceae bacterium]